MTLTEALVLTVESITASTIKARPPADSDQYLCPKGNGGNHGRRSHEAEFNKLAGMKASGEARGGAARGGADCAPAPSAKRDSSLRSE